MGEISVQFESLRSGASGIGANYAQLSSTLDQLTSDLQPMISSWSGAAQESYLVAKARWDEGANELAQVLRSIGVAVGQAHENYSQAEGAALNNFR